MSSRQLSVQDVLPARLRPVGRSPAAEEPAGPRRGKRRRRWYRARRWTSAAAPATTPSTWPSTAGRSPASTTSPRRWTRPAPRRPPTRSTVNFARADVTRLSSEGIGSELRADRRQRLPARHERRRSRLPTYARSRRWRRPDARLLLVEFITRRVVRRAGHRPRRGRAAVRRGLDAAVVGK